MTAADESRVVWRHEADDDLRRALLREAARDVIEAWDGRAVQAIDTAGLDALDALRAALAARSEPRAEGHRYDHDGEHMWWLCDPPHPASGPDLARLPEVIQQWNTTLALDAATPPAEGLRQALKDIEDMGNVRGYDPLTAETAGKILRAALAAMPPAEGLDDRVARAFSDGYRAGLTSEVDDWNASPEAIAEYGRQYAALAPEQPE